MFFTIDEAALIDGLIASYFVSGSVSSKRKQPSCRMMQPGCFLSYALDFLSSANFFCFRVFRRGPFSTFIVKSSLIYVEGGYMMNS